MLAGALMIMQQARLRDKCASAVRVLRERVTERLQRSPSGARLLQACEQLARVLQPKWELLCGLAQQAWEQLASLLQRQCQWELLQRQVPQLPAQLSRLTGALRDAVAKFAALAARAPAGASGGKKKRAGKRSKKGFERATTVETSFEDSGHAKGIIAEKEEEEEEEEEAEASDEEGEGETDEEGEGETDEAVAARTRQGAAAAGVRKAADGLADDLVKINVEAADGADEVGGDVLESAGPKPGPMRGGGEARQLELDGDAFDEFEILSALKPHAPTPRERLMSAPQHPAMRVQDGDAFDDFQSGRAVAAARARKRHEEVDGAASLDDAPPLGSYSL